MQHRFLPVQTKGILDCKSGRNLILLLYYLYCRLMGMMMMIQLFPILYLFSLFFCFDSWVPEINVNFAGIEACALQES